MKKVLTFLEILVFEPLRFICVSLLFLFYYRFTHLLGGGGKRCGWIEKGGETQNGKVFNVSFVDGTCFSISQMIITIVLLLLFYFLIFFCSWKLKVSKLWSIYGLFPLGVLLYFILTSHTIP